MPIAFPIALLVAAIWIGVLPWIHPRDAWARVAYYYVYIVTFLIYISFRLTQTLPPVEADLRTLATYLYFGFELWLWSLGYRQLRLMRGRRDRVDDANANEGWYRNGPTPLVDFFIPTYNENHALLERAIVSAQAQDYERARIWVLDDGRRPWVRDLADQLGVGYLTRSNNAFFKAGNLNNALDHVMALEDRPDYIAVLDCDFVAKPAFVRRAMALMYDPETGLVQTPQVYLNDDIFQHRFGLRRWLPDQQRSAFDHGLPARDAFGAVTCHGTTFLVRTSCLSKIGGFPTETVAEDAMTSHALREAGYQTVYLNEILSFGIVAEGVNEFLTQYGRWCLGAVQILHTRFGGLGAKGLSLGDRIRSLEQSLAWGIFSALRIIWLWSPITLWFGRNFIPMSVNSASGFALLFAVTWGCHQLSDVWMIRGTNLPILGDARTLLGASVVVRASWRGLVKSKNQRFVVTDKGLLRGRTVVHWRLLRWHLLALFATVVGVVYGTMYPQGVLATAGPEYSWFLWFWTLRNVLTLCITCILCVEPPQRRQEERFTTNESIVLTAGGRRWTTRARDLSVSGAFIERSDSLAPGTPLTLLLEDVGTVKGAVVRTTKRGVGISFDAGEEEHRRLILKLFSDRYISPTREANLLRVYTGLARALVS